MAFFQGTLQEGIDNAVQQSKSVVCFVTDGEAESKQWEDEFLADENVSALLRSQAVILRLEAGSQEEGFLTQLYPIPKKPTVVIIKNAELKEYIASGVSKADFMRRIQQVLQPAQPASAPTQANTHASPIPALTPSQPQPSPVSSGSSAPQSANEVQVQSLLAERAARLAVQKKKDEEEARKRRQEKAKAKAESAATNPTSQSNYADSIKKKQREAREERQRILKAIEDDKAARRARQAENEAKRRAAAAGGGGEETTKEETPFAPASPLYPTTSRVSTHCALQVRLLDGSTLRSRFTSNDTLKDVRQWVDGTTEGKVRPYTFKILLTPLPSKTVDVTEEGKTLGELGLTPSATLILLPVVKKKVASAYAAAATTPPDGGNVVSRFIAYILSFITAFFAVVAGFFSTLFSTAGPPEPVPRETSGSDQGVASASGRDKSRIGAVRRTDERRNDQQFYNGNSTNFQPRPDDDEE